MGQCSRYGQDRNLINYVGQFLSRDRRSSKPSSLNPHLTPRQAEVLRLLERGHSTHQIARELHLSIETVRNHIRHLLRALGVHSRIEAVAMARHGELAAT